MAVNSELAKLAKSYLETTKFWPENFGKVDQSSDLGKWLAEGYEKAAQISDLDELKDMCNDPDRYDRCVASAARFRMAEVLSEILPTIFDLDQLFQMQNRMPPYSLARQLIEDRTVGVIISTDLTSEPSPWLTHLVDQRIGGYLGKAVWYLSRKVVSSI